MYIHPYSTALLLQVVNSSFTGFSLARQECVLVVAVSLQNFEVATSAALLVLISLSWKS